MKTPKRWANIVCNQDMQPYLLIVTDGKNTWETPVKNSSIETCKRAARDIYDVPKSRLLITQVMDNASDEKQS